MSIKPEFNIPCFKDVKVSTKTYIASSNINIDIQKLFDVIDVCEYKVEKKKRGRRKKDAVVNDTIDLEYGSVVTVKYEDKLKGVNLTKNKSSTKTWFRNSLTIVVFLDKLINFKVCKNGTFQMTGCKTWDHPMYCIKFVWNLIRNMTALYDFKKDDMSEFCSYIIPSMRNIDFDIGFKIDRQRLYNALSKSTNFFCLMETSFGYTGVNVKIPIENDRNDLNIKKIVMSPDNIPSIELVTYRDYLNTLDEQNKINKNKQRYNTFLIFHSGKIIFSGISSFFMEEVYKKFTTELLGLRDQIKEELYT